MNQEIKFYDSLNSEFVIVFTWMDDSPKVYVKYFKDEKEIHDIEQLSFYERDFMAAKLMEFIMCNRSLILYSF